MNPVYAIPEEVKLIIFDLDGTIRVNPNGDWPGAVPKEITDIHFIPGAVEIVSLMFRMGYKLGVASNQATVEQGELTIEQAWHLAFTTMAFCGVAMPADAVQICPDHSACRKPLPYMLNQIMNHYRLKPGQTLFVGNAESDKETAAAAQCHFAWADEFFRWPAYKPGKHREYVTEQGQTIYEATKEMQAKVAQVRKDHKLSHKNGRGGHA